MILGLAGGLATGGLGWWSAGGPSRPEAPLAAAEARLAKLRIPRALTEGAVPPDVAVLAATPLFVLTTGPGATPAPVLRLDGLSRSKGRAAALLSVDDQPAEWLALGDSRGGVTVLAVDGTKAVIDTVYGPVDVGLGERVGTPGAAGGAASLPLGASPGGVETGAHPAPVQPTIVDRPPPGFRSPPPPASAPGTP